MALNLFDFDFIRPTRLLDQHIDLGLNNDDFLTSHMRHHHRIPLLGAYYRPWRMQNNDSGSTMKFDKDKFIVSKVYIKMFDDSQELLLAHRFYNSIKISVEFIKMMFIYTRQLQHFY